MTPADAKRLSAVHPRRDTERPDHQPDETPSRAGEGELLFHGVALRLATVVTFLRMRQENTWTATQSCCRLFRNREFRAAYPGLRWMTARHRWEVYQRAIDNARKAADQEPHVFVNAGNRVPLSFVIEMLVSRRDNTLVKVLKCVNFYLSLAVRHYCPDNNFVDYVPHGIRQEVTKAAIGLVISDSLAGIDRTCVEALPLPFECNVSS